MNFHSLPCFFFVKNGRQEWQDFATFDFWVTNNLHDVEELVGLVVFHPSFWDLLKEFSRILGKI